MSEPVEPPGPMRRLGYAAVGLLAAEAALFVCVFQAAIRQAGWRREFHVLFEGYLENFEFLAIFVCLGWLIAGVPSALLLPPRVLVRLRWRWILLIGAALGCLALILIFFLLMLAGASLGGAGHRTQGILWMGGLAALMSAAGFSTYVALLRRGEWTRTDL